MTNVVQIQITLIIVKTMVNVLNLKSVVLMSVHWIIVLLKGIGVSTTLFTVKIQKL